MSDVHPTYIAPPIHAPPRPSSACLYATVLIWYVPYFLSSVGQASGPSSGGAADRQGPGARVHAGVSRSSPDDSGTAEPAQPVRHAHEQERASRPGQASFRSGLLLFIYLFILLLLRR